jgi:hypothetical protein
MESLLYGWALVAKIIVGVCTLGLFWSFIRYRDWEAARILFIPFYGFGYSLFMMGRVLIPIFSFGYITVQEKIEKNGQFSRSKNDSKEVVLGPGWAELFGLVLIIMITVLACIVFV